MSAVKIFGGHPPSRGSQKNFDLGGRRGKGLGDWQMLLPTGLAPWTSHQKNSEPWVHQPSK